jgi:hypothetical protein
MDPRFFRHYLDILNERVVVGPDGKPEPRKVSDDSGYVRSPEEEKAHQQAQKDIEDTLKARDARIDAENKAMRQQGTTRGIQLPK